MQTGTFSPDWPIGFLAMDVGPQILVRAEDYQPYAKEDPSIGIILRNRRDPNGTAQKNETHLQKERSFQCQNRVEKLKIH